MKNNEDPPLKGWDCLEPVPKCDLKNPGLKARVSPTIMQKISLPVTLEAEECLPHYATSNAAGADVKAYIQDDRLIAPGERALIPTGIRMEIPEGFEVQVRPRSGLALKHGITVLNTPGTIDADYRGEIQVLLINHSDEPFTVTPGMRIAQLILAPVVQAEFKLTQALSSTLRGEGGFGHTGTHTKPCHQG